MSGSTLLGLAPLEISPSICEYQFPESQNRNIILSSKVVMKRNHVNI